jgi:hypothetical protein
VHNRIVHEIARPKEGGFSPWSGQYALLLEKRYIGVRFYRLVGITPELSPGKSIISQKTRLALEIT